MVQSRRITVFCNILLLAVAMIWGFCFLFQKDCSASIGPGTFMMVRYFLSALTILPFIIFLEKKKKPDDRIKYDKHSVVRLIKLSAVLAVFQMINMLLNQGGIAYTTASKAAFLTATYMVMVPIFSLLLFKGKTPVMGWIGSIIGIIGIYFLSITGDFSINIGDLMIIGSSIFAATHFLLLQKLIQTIDGKHFICVEFFIAAVYCSFICFFIEKPSLSDLVECMDSLLIASILGGGICYMLMVTAQKYTDPTIAALIMSLESLFGAIAGVIFMGDTFTGREIFGAALLTFAVMISQLKPRNRIVLKVKYKSDEVQNGTK